MDLLAVDPFEKSGSNVYNMVGPARFTEVKCYYKLVVYGSCMAQDIRPQFTSREEYIDLRDPHY